MSPNILNISNNNIFINETLTAPGSPFMRQVLTFTIADRRIHWNTSATVLKQVHVSCVLQSPQHQDTEMYTHTTQHQVGCQHPESELYYVQRQEHIHLVCMWLLTICLIPQPITPFLFCIMFLPGLHFQSLMFVLWASSPSTLFFLLINSLSNGQFFCTGRLFTIVDSSQTPPSCWQDLHDMIIWLCYQLIHLLTVKSVWHVYVTPRDNPFQTVLMESSLIH